MSVSLAGWIVGLAGVYLGIGVVFAVPFLVKGIGKIDPVAAEGTVGFKIIIFPGVMALWPLLARRWMSGATMPPEEKSPHRTAARTSRAGHSTGEAS
jgi:hypothetical protein